MLRKTCCEVVLLIFLAAVCNVAAYAWGGEKTSSNADAGKSLLAGNMEVFGGAVLRTVKASGTDLGKFVSENGPTVINEQVEDFIVGKASDYQIVALGECHFYDPEEKLIANLVPKLYGAGVRYLVLEIESRFQNEVDTYLRSGKETPEFKRAIAGFEPAYKEILSNAREFSDLQVIAIDPRSSAGVYDGYKFKHGGNDIVAGKIKDSILAADPDGKIFIYYGAGHLQKNYQNTIVSLLAGSTTVYTINCLVSSDILSDGHDFWPDRYKGVLNEIKEHKLNKFNLITELKPDFKFYSAIHSGFGSVDLKDEWLGTQYDALLYLGNRQ